MCLPATLRILDPANLFCNMQCTTVCITAAGSRVAKRTPGSTPGMCPGGLPQRVARQDCRSAPEGCFPVIEPSLRRPGNLSSSHLSQAS